LLSESEEAHPTLGSRYWIAAKQEQAERRWIMHHSLKLVCRSNSAFMPPSLMPYVPSHIRRQPLELVLTVRRSPIEAKKERTDPLCETREWGHQLARWLAFLTIAINRVVSEVLAHLGVVTQRSKGNNYSSAGATILP
jgi:hypothetical protein